MSEQNVQIVRTLFAWWGTPEMSRSFELFADDIEIELVDRLPGFAPSYRGQAAVREFWREWLGAWDVVDIVDYELREDGDGVHVTWTQEMRGKGSDVPMRLPQAAHFTLRDGKVTRIRYFNLAAPGR